MRNLLIELSAYRVQLFPVQLQYWHSLVPFLSLFPIYPSSFFQMNLTFWTFSALFCLGFSPQASDFVWCGLFFHTLHTFDLSSLLLRTYLGRILVRVPSPSDDFPLVGPGRLCPLFYNWQYLRCYQDIALPSVHMSPEDSSRIKRLPRPWKGYYGHSTLSGYNYPEILGSVAKDPSNR